ncbi:hypothetical protein [Hyalangium rubrum]|uniref:Lipoprotein n=1 Tax=Hyalangium rubrum TaxID=3103134 RepID=A0ABU5H1A2_9BACT|nr:hypothetical protein [Hyalangium sp. s54d21]MDY7227086.1 hypothetical protein [Hyalangium sp. s54d21]
MRLAVWMGLMATCVLAGCAARQGGTGIPDEEAIYDVPLEELWPSVHQFFTASQLPFREDKGRFVLETEWREEFGGSRVSGFWHRYLVLGKRETPSRGKLWVIRITRSANKTLADPGDQIDWGVSRSLGDASEEGGVPNNSAEDTAAFMSTPMGENAIVAGSAQGQRDLVMEWKVFHAIAPRLARKQVEPAQSVAQAPAKESAPASPVALECGMPIIGLSPQVQEGRVMLLGEMHGTQEVPRFVAQSVCQTASSGTPVTVGLELPAENQQRVATFLRSAGTDDDWLKLMEAPFWRSPFPDGRGSEGMANLLDQLRRLRAQGLDVDVFVFDHPKQQGQAREEAMAATVLSFVRQSPRRFFLVLSGNIHPRTAPGLPWDAKYRPMGMFLSEQHEKLVALDMAYNSGTAWICAVGAKGEQLECGVKEAKGKDNGDRFFVHLWGGPNEEGYHGVFYVGPVTASLPVVTQGLGQPGLDTKAHPSQDQAR